MWSSDYLYILPALACQLFFYQRVLFPESSRITSARARVCVCQRACVRGGGGLSPPASPFRSFEADLSPSPRALGPRRFYWVENDVENRHSRLS